MQVRAYDRGDRAELERLVRLLFPDEGDAEWGHLAPRLARTPLFVLDRGSDGRLGGYVEAGTRAYAEGCDTSPVAYVEAWYVDRDLRRQGWGARLVATVENWARAQGLTELASDAVIANQTSIDAHRAIGFQEIERQACFRKPLAPVATDERVRAVAPADRAELLRMYRLLFPDADAESDVHARVSRDFRGAVFVLDRGDGRLGGFIEAGWRAYAPGCDSSPVPFVEAWWVDADLRRAGAGRALVAAVEHWAHARGEVELASDVLIENVTSILAHGRLGFVEVERIACFRKAL